MCAAHNDWAQLARTRICRPRARSIDCRAMFEARFQSFDDPARRRKPAPRVQALRAELARRGLSGFILPRADRHQNEYVPPSEERLAWLTGFTGSAGTRRRARRSSRAVRRRPLHAAGREPGRRRACSRSCTRPRRRPDQWLESNLPAGAKLGYDPWLHTVEGAERLARRLRQRRRDAGADRAQSDRRDLDRPAAAAARAGGAARPALRRRNGSAKLDAHPRRDRQACAPTRSSCPTRTRSPGPSTSAAPTSRTRRCRSPSPSCRKDGRPTLYVDGAKLSNAVRHRSKSWPRCASPPSSSATSRRSAPRTAPCGSTRRPAPTRSSRIVTDAGGKVAARARSDRADEGGEERGRDRRRARGAPPRRRGGDALPRLVRPRGAGRQAHRDRRGRGAGKLPPRHRRCSKDVSFPTISGAGRTAPSCTTA